MDRYQNQETTSTKRPMSRLAKNEELYEDLGTTMKYTTISREIPAVPLDEVRKNYRTREGYHQGKEFANLFDEEIKESKKELQALHSLYDLEGAKVYDINSILEQAKKERTMIDEKEKKRNLKNEKYNILSHSNEKELEALKKKKNLFQEEKDQEELQELIDTITSHNLRKEIDEAQEGGLLADLMATSASDKIAPKIEEKEEEITLKGIDDQRLVQDLDSSFYTRSMDLSDKDFDMDDELEEETKDSKAIILLKIFLLLILMVVVIVGAYFIVKSF